MNFDDYIYESFNLGEAGKHLTNAAQHSPASPEYKKHMTLHHSQMYWHHTHLGDSANATHHFAQMKQHDVAS